jgi:hypothetical protein
LDGLYKIADFGLVLDISKVRKSRWNNRQFP